MGGLGMILAGGLQGVGAGLAEKGKQDADQRWQMAMEALRNSNQQSNIRLTGQVQDENAANEATRDDWKDSRHVGRTTTSTMAIDTHQGAIKGALDKASDQRDLTKALTVAQVTSSLRTQEDAASKRLADQLEDENRRGEIQAIDQAPDGTMIVTRKDGTIIRTNTKMALPTTAAGASLDALGLGGPAGTLPAAQRGAPAPRAAPAATAPRRPAAAKTYTAADAAYTAKQHGISVADVNKRMQQAGYKLVGG
jgi:hypothetical protein